MKRQLYIDGSSGYLSTKSMSPGLMPCSLPIVNRKMYRKSFITIKESSAT